MPGHVLKTCESKVNCCVCDDKDECSCVCDCYGYFDTKSDGWDFDPNIHKLPVFSSGDIKILYWDKIKVFYAKVKYA